MAKNIRIVQNIDSSERFQILLNFLNTNLHSTDMKLCAFGELETVYGDLKSKFVVSCHVQTHAVLPATSSHFQKNYMGDVCDVLKEVNRYLQQINCVSALGPHSLHLIDTSHKVKSKDTGEHVTLPQALAMAGYGITMPAAGIKLDGSTRESGFVVYSLSVLLSSSMYTKIDFNNNLYAQDVANFIKESYCIPIGEGENCW